MSHGPGKSRYTLRIDDRRVSIGDGDNWPITWTNRDELFAFFNDGRGFDTEIADHIGSAPVIISGSPPLISGLNVTSRTGTVLKGHGEQNRKASGLVMIKDTLYCFLRNVNPAGKPKGTGSTLIYSSDYGESWKSVSWIWQEIGYPVWVNAGRNYSASTDGYAYFISPDGPSAYVDYPHIIMGRVPLGQALEERQYEFFTGSASEKRALWGSFAERQPIYTSPEGCFRPELVYNPPIDRYMLLLSSPPKDWRWYFEPNPHRKSRLAVYESKNPWGPWNEMLYNPVWCQDEDRFQPRVPAKWIGQDGLTFFLTYSCIPRGPYQFNAQRCTLIEELS